MFSVIIVAAGKSSRMGQDKQFLPLCNIPVIIHSIKAFDNIDEVIQIIVVTNEDNIHKMKELVNEYNFNKKIEFTQGGETRQQSVFNGFLLVNSTSEYIAVHDGARPLISERIILELFENVKKYKAVTVGVPVKDTIKIVKDGFICDTPEREFLFIAQTPQIFEKKLYQSGVEYALEKKLDFTDDCQLAEAVGAKVFMLSGEYSNIKITTPEDIKLAENYLEEVSK